MSLRRGPALCLVVALLATGAAGCIGDDDTDGPGAGGDETTDPTMRGAIRGVVVGPLGGIPGASVEINKVFQTVTTGGDGRFTFDGLVPESYRLTVRAEHYRQARVDVDVQPGTTDVEVPLSPIMLTGDVPAAFGKQQTIVNTQDTLLVSAGLPGSAQHAVTNMTKEATFPGFWEVEPEPGYKIAQVTAVLYWIPSGLVEQQLGIHFFRGEDPVANEVVEEALAGYHTPEPVVETPVFAFYTLVNDDWHTWGDRNWQVGVYVKEDDAAALLGAAIEHVVAIMVTYVDAAYAAGA